MKKDKHYNLFKDWIDTNKNDTLELNIEYIFSENGKIGVIIYFKDNEKAKPFEIKEFLTKIKKRVFKKINLKLNLEFQNRWELRLDKLDYSLSENLANFISHMEFSNKDSLKHKNYDFKANVIAENKNI